MRSKDEQAKEIEELRHKLYESGSNDRRTLIETEMKLKRLEEEKSIQEETDRKRVFDLQHKLDKLKLEKDQVDLEL